MHFVLEKCVGFAVRFDFVSAFSLVKCFDFRDAGVRANLRQIDGDMVEDWFLVDLVKGLDS